MSDLRALKVIQLNIIMHITLNIGYAPPSNMGSYANYLDVRVRSWREMKHDVLRIQSESNRRSDGLGAGCKLRSSLRWKLLTDSESAQVTPFTGGEGIVAGSQAGPESARRIGHVSRKLLVLSGLDSSLPVSFTTMTCEMRTLYWHLGC